MLSVSVNSNFAFGSAAPIEQLNISTKRQMKVQVMWSNEQDQVDKHPKPLFWIFQTHQPTEAHYIWDTGHDILEIFSFWIFAKRFWRTWLYSSSEISVRFSLLLKSALVGILVDSNFLKSWTKSYGYKPFLLINWN